MPVFETILVALESTALDEALLSQVLRLARREDVRLVLAHVVHPSEGGEYGGEDDQPLTLRLESAKRRLKVIAERLRAEGIEVVERVVLGEPSERLLLIASEVEASALALATHGRSGPARWLSGSVTESVLRNATLPVLVTNPAHAQPEGKSGFKRILVPLDGSPRAEGILAQVRRFALLYDAEVTLLRVGVQPAVPPMEVPLTASGFPLLRDSLSKSLSDALRHLSGVKEVSTRVMFADSAAGGILEVLESGEFDLVALGTHGRGGIDRFLFGSTAEETARKSPVPLLIYRDPALSAEA